MESTQDPKVVEQDSQPATQETTIAPTTTTEEGKKEKKNTKAEREAEKQRRLAERQAQASKKKEEEYRKDPNDPCADKFGDRELNRSQSDPAKRYEKKFTEVHELDDSKVGQEVIVSGRLHSSRPAGKKLVFIILRERFATV